MDWLKTLNDGINSFVWGAPMLVFILGSGLFLSIRTGFVQIFEFKYAIKNTLGRVFTGRKARKAARGADGAMSPFQALTTALASTVGTGNIAGITSAITLGGPGAVFWLWISSLIGMCTKYTEVVLAVRYRERSSTGEWAGGPMYYIKNGLGGRFKALAAVFSVCGAIAACGVGNAVQVGNMTASIKTALHAFFPQTARMDGRIGLIIGLVAAVLTALTLFGGVKRIGRVTEVFVPFMAALYIIASLVVIAANIGTLGAVLARIFQEAFSPASCAGGAVGISVKSAVSWGVRRGVFSNEAGLGSAPIAHAVSSEKNPVLQGLYGITEVFIDSIVICTITALTLLMSGINVPYGTAGSITMNISAFATVFGDRAAGVIIAAGMTLFALATVFGWALYGARCAEFLFGPRIIKPYQMLYVIITALGATVNLDLVWQLADTLNGLMAVPNTIAVLALSGVAAKLTKEHFEKERPPSLPHKSPARGRSGTKRRYI